MNTLLLIAAVLVGILIRAKARPSPAEADAEPVDRRTKDRRRIGRWALNGACAGLVAALAGIEAMTSPTLGFYTGDANLVFLAFGGVGAVAGALAGLLQMYAPPDDPP
ncbi:MAG TPA: hypothetical protein VF744_07485 [Beijerinckiaceae bacterium]|jgi:hypothetical protein